MARGGALLRNGSQAVASLGGADIVQCPSDVETEEWRTFRNTGLAFEFRYPAWYELVENDQQVELRSTKPAADGVTDTIVFEKFRGSPREEIHPEMHLAGWKVLDRQTFALTTSPFTTEDLRGLSEEYLFVRNFPFQTDDPRHVMVRATVLTSRKNPVLAAALQMGIVDPEDILTEQEQILSTFRFLQYTELSGRDGRNR